MRVTGTIFLANSASYKVVVSRQSDAHKEGDMRWPIFDPFLRALESSAKALQVKADGDTEIVMVLNDREFARAVEVAMEKKNSVLFG